MSILIVLVYGGGLIQLVWFENYSRSINIYVLIYYDDLYRSINIYT